MPEPAEHPARDVPADPRTNVVVKVALRSGLVSALLLLAAGLVTQLLTTRHAAVGVRMFHIGGAPTLGEVLMGFGVLVLTLTPVAGILSALAGWRREHDRVFAGVAGVVLAVLLASVLVGLVG